MTDAALIDQLTNHVRRYVRERLVPLEAEVAEQDEIPPIVRHEMAQMGLFGMAIPESYGGLGLNMQAEVALVRELGWTSPAFRSLIGTNNGLGSQGLLIDGTEEQKRTWLPQIASGEKIAAFCLTEPEAGSDAASLTTRARRDGEDYLISGTKRFITNGPTADLFTVMARTDPSKAGAAGISAFIVEAASPGLSRGKPNRKMGQKGAQVCDVIFDEVRVPARQLIGNREGEGFKTAMKVLDRGRLHIAALCCGVADRLIQESVSYAASRRQFGQAIGEFQLIQAMLADSRTENFAARSMIWETARRFDAKEPISTDAACCKYYASEMVGRVADRAVQIHGGAGYIQDYAVERFYRDVRIFRLYEGTSQIQQLVIGRAMMREAGH